MSPNSLTDHLLSLYQDQLSAATRHSFLTQAGTGRLASAPLCSWLVQDKYYQVAYANFIGRLISKIDLTSYAFPSPTAAEEEKNLPWKTLTSLMTALQAIKSEIDFYNKTVEKYGLKLEKAGPNEVTKRYVQLFEDSNKEGKPVVWGLTVLWATEFVYLKAWSHAKSQQTKTIESLSQVSMAEKDTDGPIAALHQAFIPNWTSEEFKEAVDSLAEITNLWAANKDKREEANCEKLWLTTLELEAEFWPDV